MTTLSLAPLGYRSPVSLDGMSSLCISRDCIVSCLTRLLNPVSRLPNPDRFPANFMGLGKPASLPGFLVFYDSVAGCLFTGVGIKSKGWCCEHPFTCQPI